MEEHVHSIEQRRQKPVAINVNIPRAGAIILFSDEVKNKARLRVGRIIDQIKGKDGIVIGYKTQLENGNTIEQPLQMLWDSKINTVRESITEKLMIEK